MEHPETDKGKWIPQKGYTKKCPVDGTEFTGRKNQVYCSPVCKQKAAADILSSKNQTYGSLFRSYIKNAEILHKHYPGKKELIPVPRNLLYKEGFDPSGLLQLKKLKEFEGMWNVIGGYAFQSDPKNPNNIFILKL
ncbi:MAG: hypothetical protein JXB49_05255 [Bacteroidales bacterium]|nr:hypothetical protein [Bacteroidales bacterium]